jgi:hypothetical protein
MHPDVSRGAYTSSIAEIVSRHKVKFEHLALPHPAELEKYQNAIKMEDAGSGGELNAGSETDFLRNVALHYSSLTPMMM